MYTHVFTVCLEHPTKGQNGTSITTALKFIFVDRKPITLQSDKGTEFVNANVQKYLDARELIFIQLTTPT